METTQPQSSVSLASDKALADRIARGDRIAFESMMRQYNRRLYRVAVSILNDDGEAEEALQESYLTAYQHIAGFQGNAKLSTWLTRIVVNEALQRLRKKRRHRVIVPFAGTDIGEEDTTMSDATKPETPEKATARAELRRLLEREVGKLPVAFRTVFILREAEDMTVEETADCLDLPLATVRTRLFRAKSQLREALAKEIDLATAGAFDFAGVRCERIVSTVRARLSILPSGVDK
jgi:RNA polymerase sigma-70 factor, ECF subfamily